MIIRVWFFYFMFDWLLITFFRYSNSADSLSDTFVHLTNYSVNKHFEVSSGAESSEFLSSIKLYDMSWLGGVKCRGFHPGYILQIQFISHMAFWNGSSIRRGLFIIDGAGDGCHDCKNTLGTHHRRPGQRRNRRSGVKAQHIGCFKVVFVLIFISVFALSHISCFDMIYLCCIFSLFVHFVFRFHSVLHSLICLVLTFYWTHFGDHGFLRFVVFSVDSTLSTIFNSCIEIYKRIVLFIRWICSHLCLVISPWISI